MAPIRRNDKKDIVLVQLADIKRDSTLVYLDGVKNNSRRDVQFTVVPKKNLKKFNEVLISNEVFILGYPNALGSPKDPQIQNNVPLLRKGIIAGKNTVNQTIILDCPVYFGNSGGLAIEVENFDDGQKHFKVIGVVSQYIPFIEHMQSIQLGYVNKNYENSGYSVAVPIDTIVALTKAKPIIVGKEST